MKKIILTLIFSLYFSYASAVIVDYTEATLPQLNQELDNKIDTTSVQTIYGEKTFGNINGDTATFTTLAIGSTSPVTNLNSDYLDSQSGAYYLALANATGTLATTNGGTGTTKFAYGITSVAAGTGVVTHGLTFSNTTYTILTSMGYSSNRGVPLVVDSDLTTTTAFTVINANDAALSCHWIVIGS